jgi:hypothetical protein
VAMAVQLGYKVSSDEREILPRVTGAARRAA